jgi:hypothetical protein
MRHPTRLLNRGIGRLYRDIRVSDAAMTEAESRLYVHQIAAIRICQNL